MKNRETKCAFVVFKLIVKGRDYYILRRDKDWNDLNLIGGHQEVKDNGNLLRTARRELFEELSALRGAVDIKLIPITDKVKYGPVWSESARKQSTYHLQFYLAELKNNPAALSKTLSPQSMNYLVDSDELKLAMEQKDVSNFLSLLESTIQGGLEAIPYSWQDDLSTVLDKNVLSKRFQKQLPLELDSRH